MRCPPIPIDSKIQIRSGQPCDEWGGVADSVLGLSNGLGNCLILWIMRSTLASFMKRFFSFAVLMVSALSSANPARASSYAK